MRILRAIYKFIKKRIGNRPSDMPNMKLGKWVYEDLKYYEKHVPDNLKFVDFKQKENRK